MKKKSIIKRTPGSFTAHLKVFRNSKSGKLYANLCNRVVAIKPGTTLARHFEELLNS